MEVSVFPDSMPAFFADSLLTEEDKFILASEKCNYRLPNTKQQIKISQFYDEIIFWCKDLVDRGLMNIHKGLKNDLFINSPLGDGRDWLIEPMTYSDGKIEISIFGYGGVRKIAHLEVWSVSQECFFRILNDFVNKTTTQE